MNWQQAQEMALDESMPMEDRIDAVKRIDEITGHKSKEGYSEDTVTNYVRQCIEDGIISDYVDSKLYDVCPHGINMEEGLEDLERRMDVEEHESPTEICVHGKDVEEFCEVCGKEVESQEFSGTVTLLESEVIRGHGYQNSTVVMRAKVCDGKMYEVFTHVHVLPNEENGNRDSYCRGHYHNRCLGSALNDYAERCKKYGV